MMKQLFGTGVALVTPFRADLTVDEAALRRIVDFCIDGGTDYLVILGTTGEPVTLGRKEKQIAVKTIIDQNRDRLPLVIGMGGNNTLLLAEELKATDLGPFEAVLSVSPYYNKPTQEGIYRHYRVLADASAKPVIAYNVPGRTASNILPETVLRLASDCENLVGIKEASGDMGQVNAILRAKPADFMVISGDDFTALPTVLAGGAGVISVLGQGMPSQFSRMIRLGMQGMDSEAYAMHQELLEAMELIFQEGNPAGIKALLEIQGLCTAAVRLPLVEASPGLKESLRAYMHSYARAHA
jgi:4-hydroxy-tetrahydrodipicolinate synthase